MIAWAYRVRARFWARIARTLKALSDKAWRRAARAASSEALYSPTVRARLATCAKCPALRANRTCADCGCYMPAKARLPKAKCPRGLWGPLK